LAAIPPIALAMSPVYTGPHPSFPVRWQFERDSPTLDWLPARAWGVGRTVRVTFVPVVPNLETPGKVDVDIVVGQGASAVRVRVATVQVSQ
jgi:hypothetical protein